MGRTIPVELSETPEIEIDGARVARALGLAPEAFRQLMDDRKVTVLCERGTGADEGLFRATFYHGGRRARLVVARDGTLVADGPGVDGAPVGQGG